MLCMRVSVGKHCTYYVLLIHEYLNSWPTALEHTPEQSLSNVYFLS